MSVHKPLLLVVAVAGAVALGGCGDRSFWGGAAAGAVGAGGAYEYQAKRAMDQLEEDRAEGRITEEEYERRREEIRRRSLLQ
jgi:hypothetical protein